jgi:predicted amino acid racemase
MTELSALADVVDATFGPIVRTVSGGNSANLDWALSGASVGRINNLRLGEALLLGREPLHRKAIEGLHTDAITVVAEVIESKGKPSKPWGEVAQSAFGDVPPSIDRGDVAQAIFAIGRQDTDPEGLTPPAGVEIRAASSDHLIVESMGSHKRLCVGGQIPFQLNYSALLRAMTSPFVTRVMKQSSEDALT